MFDLNLSYVDSSFVLNGFVYVYNSSAGWWELNPYWLKVADNGDFLWEKYGLENPDYGLGSSRYSTILNSGGIVTVASENYDSFHVLIDKDGNEVISQTLNRPDSIITTTSNSMETYLDTLILNGRQFFVTGFNGIGCGVIQKTDTLGNLIDEVVLPNNTTVVTPDIEITFDNKILAISTYDLPLKKFMLTKYNENFEYDSIYTRPFTYDSLCPGGITSGNIDLGCSVITGIKDEIKEGHAKLTLAPNPARDYTIVYLPETIDGNEKQGPFSVTTVRSDYVRNLKMEVFDLNGRKVSAPAWPDGVKEQILNTSAWPTGLYLIRISNPERTIATGKLLINR